MIKISKKFIFGIPLAIISLEIYLGIIFGYFFGKFLAGKYDGHQRIKSIILDIGRYRLHLHHWLISLLILIFTFFFPSPLFLPGFFGGLVFQGISNYSDWHKILIKKI